MYFTAMCGIECDELRAQGAKNRQGECIAAGEVIKLKERSTCREVGKDCHRCGHRNMNRKIL